WHLMELAGRYAYAGREWVARKVVQIMGSRELEPVHNHHNYAWRETHDGDEFIVVRKGPTPAFPRQKRHIDGSIAGDAAHGPGPSSVPTRRRSPSSAPRCTPRCTAPAGS